MSSPEPITYWLKQLEAGDAQAAQRLWERYFRQLVALARRHLLSAPRRVADEEDVALSAFDSFCRGVAQARFPQLGDRHDLWRLLVVLTVRKAADLLQWERRLKRAGAGSAAAGPFDPDARPAPEPTPELAAQLVEEYQRLLARLDEPGLRSVAVWRMEGYTVEEIAGRLGCTTRTVERKLRVIRSLWAESGGEP
jgi:DNA-directed RNA polymerase specialized sigma24 family protein